VRHQVVQRADRAGEDALRGDRRLSPGAPAGVEIPDAPAGPGLECEELRGVGRADVHRAVQDRRRRLHPGEPVVPCPRRPSGLAVESEQIVAAASDDHRPSWNAGDEVTGAPVSCRDRAARRRSRLRTRESRSGTSRRRSEDGRPASRRSSRASVPCPSSRPACRAGAIVGGHQHIAADDGRSRADAAAGAEAPERLSGAGVERVQRAVVGAREHRSREVGRRRPIARAQGPAPSSRPGVKDGQPRCPQGLLARARPAVPLRRRGAPSIRPAKSAPRRGCQSQ